MKNKEDRPKKIASKRKLGWAYSVACEPIANATRKPTSETNKPKKREFF